MSKIFNLPAVLLLALSAAGCRTSESASSAAVPDGWQAEVARELPRMGHRNFIVIADAAYPLQSAPGIRTIHIGGTQADALKQVLALLREQKHVRPVAWVDAEQAAVAEADAPGIGQCRSDIAAALTGTKVERAPHMDIIRRLDESSKLFNVLLLKTDETLPYTSVFLELDCGYWDGDKEKRLHKSLTQ